LNIFLYIISIPLFTFPISILYLCHCMTNIMDDRKMFSGIKFNKRIWKQILLLSIVSYFSMYSIYMLMIMSHSFISYLIVALIISFNLISYLLALYYKDKLIVILRTAFFYSIAYFYKTVLIIFILLIVISRILVFKQFLVVILAPSLFFYILLKINYRTLIDLKGLNK
jgi:hypothetical protein